MNRHLTRGLNQEASAANPGELEPTGAALQTLGALALGAAAIGALAIGALAHRPSGRRPRPNPTP